MKIVTSGAKYLDIDGYAAIIAYAELLGKQGVAAVASSDAVPNASVTDDIQTLAADLVLPFWPEPEDTFVIMDESNPEQLDEAVSVDKVDELFDHHVGFEDFWQEKLGVNAHIEWVGSVCTQVYEKWVEAGLLNDISEMSAKLLVCGILDNTLDFNAEVANERDHAAFEALVPLAKFAGDAREWYFSGVQASVERDLSFSIKNDLKVANIASMGGTVAFAQITVWNGNSLIKTAENEILDIMDETGERWLISLISISEKKNYFIASGEDVKQGLDTLIGAKFVAGKTAATSDKLILRKELLKADILYQNNS